MDEPSNVKKPRSQPLTSPIKAFSTQRPFTEDDEITVLKGMLEYSEKKAAKVEYLAVKAKENNRALSALEAELPSSLVKPTEVDKKSSKSLGSLFNKRSGVGGLEEEVLKHELDMIGVEKKAALVKK
ncbi:hypothetical protein PTKIN_Ptkin02bG0024000 [Pterospermum kingtungense]